MNCWLRVKNSIRNKENNNTSSLSHRRSRAPSAPCVRACVRANLGCHSGWLVLLYSQLLQTGTPDPAFEKVSVHLLRFLGYLRVGDLLTCIPIMTVRFLMLQALRWSCTGARPSGSTSTRRSRSGAAASTSHQVGINIISTAHQPQHDPHQPAHDSPCRRAAIETRQQPANSFGVT